MLPSQTKCDPFDPPVYSMGQCTSMLMFAIATAMHASEQCMHAVCVYIRTGGCGQYTQVHYVGTVAM